MPNGRLNEAQGRIKTVERKINKLRYADDTTLMAKSEEKLKSLLMKVREESEKAGLKVYDRAIALLGIYPEETKIEKDTCIPLFIAALFTIARTWRQPRSPLTDEWIKKLWYIYTMEYYLVIKRNTFEPVLMRMNLEPIVQGEVSQKKKNKYCTLTHIYGI